MKKNPYILAVTVHSILETFFHIGKALEFRDMTRICLVIRYRVPANSLSWVTRERLLLAFICLSLLFSGPAAAIDRLEVLDPPLLFEISGHSESGFFSEIHSVSVDQDNFMIYVLHETPAVLSGFYIGDGREMKHIKIKDRVEAPAAVISCFGKILIISERRLWSLNEESELDLFFTGPGDDDPAVDDAACVSGNLLFAGDAKNMTLYRVNAGGKFAAAAAAGAVSDKWTAFKAKKTFMSISDIAEGRMDTFYVLDNVAGMVRRFGTAGREFDSFVVERRRGNESPVETVSIAADAEAHVWVLNRAQNTVDAFDSFGDMVLRIEAVGKDGFRFTDPVRIDIDQDNSRLLISDRGSMSVKAFGIGQ